MGLKGTVDLVKSEVSEWNRAGFSDREMWQWQAVNVDTPEKAQEWLRLGYSISDVDFLQDVDITEPGDAYVWGAQGVKAYDVCLAIDAGVQTPEERKVWLDNGIRILDVAMFKRLGYDAESAGSVARELEACGRGNFLHSIESAAILRKKAEEGSTLAAVLSVHVAPVVTIKFIQRDAEVEKLIQALSLEDLKRVVQFLEQEYSPYEEFGAENLAAICSVISD